MMKKGYVVLSVLSLCFLGTSIPVHAEGNQEIVPYARVCSCGKGTYQVISKTSTPWTTASEVKCNSHTYGTDLIQKSITTTTYQCNSCGRGYSTNTTQTRRVCHGYDR